MNKYKLTTETCTVDGRTLYRIQATKSFCGIKRGDLGGFVEHINNLSQSSDCWIFDNACVYDRALVYGDATIRHQSRVFEDAIIGGRAIVGEEAKIFDHAVVMDDSRAEGQSRIHGYVRLHGSNDFATIADISSEDDFATVKGFGSVNRNTTFYHTKDNDIHVVCGCFQGTLQKFRNKVRETHGTNKYAEEYLILADLMEKRFESRKRCVKKVEELIIET